MTPTDLAARQALPPEDRQLASRRQRAGSLLSALSLGAMIYGLILWIYVAICGLVAPYTLSLPLTHLIPFLREDTSGFLGFAVSFIGFVVYRVTTHTARLPQQVGKWSLA